MVSGIDSAVAGLASAGKCIQASANAIANQSTSTKQAAQPPKDKVSLSSTAANTQSSAPQSEAEPLVNLDTATYNFQANLISLKVQENTQQSLLDIKS